MNKKVRIELLINENFIIIDGYWGFIVVKFYIVIFLVVFYCCMG